MSKPATAENTVYFEMKTTALIFVVLSALLASCESSDSSDNQTPPPETNYWTFEEFLTEAETTDVNARTALVDSFIAYWDTIAIPPVTVEPDSEFGSAAFLYRSPGNTITVAGDFNGWNPNGDLTQVLSGTTLHYAVKRFEKNARFDYKFVVNGNTWVLDPLNPRTFPGGFGPNSQMWMPDFAPPAEAVVDTSIPHGTSQTFSFHSDILNNTRTITVFLPAGYDVEDSTRRYSVLYCHDGNDYRNFLRITTIADNMIADGSLAAFVIVMVPPVNRSQEYHMNPDFARAFVEELIVRVDSTYNTVASREGRTIVGESSGGIGALYLAWHRHESFKYCIAQSGYFSFSGDAIIDSIQENPVRDVKIYMNVGTYETAIGGSENLLAAQQRLEQVLVEKGYAHRAVYLPDGHSWANWQRVMPDALEWIW